MARHRLIAIVGDAREDVVRRAMCVRILAASGSDADKKAQEARSTKYGIAVREDGNVTKPSQFAPVPDSQWLDPVNYAYPCPDADHTRSAASYWGKAADKAKYSDADRKVIDQRLAMMEKRFKIGTTNARAAAGSGASMSYDEIRDLVWDRLGDGEYILELFPDHVIIECCDDECLYSVPYTLSADGSQAVLGERTEVAREYVTVTAAWKILAATDGPVGPDKGYKWDVQILAPGPDKAGLFNYLAPAVKAAAPLYEGARVFALTQGQHDDPKKPYGKSVRDLVGWISDTNWNGSAIIGKLNILKTAKWLRDTLVDLAEAKQLDLLGLSHDAQGMTAKGPAKGPMPVEKILGVDSVDVVYNPIGGGKIMRMAAARKAGHKEGTMWKQLLAALKIQRPDLKDRIEMLEAKGDAVDEGEVSEFVTTAMAAAVGGAQQKDEIKEHLTKLMASVTEVTTKQAQELVAQATKKFEDTQKLLGCATMLVEEMEESRLPEILKVRLQKQFSGRVFEAEELKAAIKEEKEIADKLTGSGSLTGVGGLRTEIGEGEPEKLQAALDKLMGVDVEEQFRGVPAFRGLRAAYTRLTGDTDLRGIPSREGTKLGEAFMQQMQLPAAYATSSFSFVLGNSMYRRLIKEYNAVNYREDALISYYRNAENFKTMEIIQVGYFGDVPDVDPETADYQEITMPTDIEATYAINQKGWILTVTRKVILNDDLKTISQLVSKMGRAHRRTHARRAWLKIIDNATFKGDTTAVFHNDHGNLGSVALTADATGITTLTNRFKAMYDQEEQDSGECLALVPKYLWVSRSGLEIAQALNQPWTVVGGPPNPHAGKFGKDNENIVCNPLFTDTNDWGLIADANDVELLEAAYINGRREPEFFVADNPIVGQMFVADKIQYKSRHEFEFEIADYRGFDKSVVAGG